MKGLFLVVFLMWFVSQMNTEETEEYVQFNVIEDPYPRLPRRNYSCSTMACPARHICGCMPTPITPETPYRDLDCGCYHEYDMMPVCEGL
uniref:U-scoloptoxin(12)-Er1a n=1 Tax=Ethmostigmus rubripes TaxID=62613 RepID=TXC1A_ETHRU|nr:RecName: Full=U-scoloptoxin(12)-Er1a; Short=U-SLPTX(12)-Er1a; Flags: Precursor [Ethmostigmus rubripes]